MEAFGPTGNSFSLVQDTGTFDTFGGGGGDFDFDWNQFSSGLMGLASAGLTAGLGYAAATQTGQPYTPTTQGGTQPAQKTTAPAQSGMSTTMLVVVLVVILVILAMAAYFITKKSA